MASTLVSETVSPASLSAVSASKGLSTIIRRMPKLVVSAMDRARISMPAPGKNRRDFRQPSRLILNKNRKLFDKHKPQPFLRCLSPGFGNPLWV